MQRSRRSVRATAERILNYTHFVGVCEVSYRKLPGAKEGVRRVKEGVRRAFRITVFVQIIQEHCRGNRSQ